jgi:hypothetical protein
MTNLDLYEPLRRRLTKDAANERARLKRAKRYDVQQRIKGTIRGLERAVRAVERIQGVR